MIWFKFLPNCIFFMYMFIEEQWLDTSVLNVLKVAETGLVQY